MIIYNFGYLKINLFKPYFDNAQAILAIRDSDNA